MRGVLLTRWDRVVNTQYSAKKNQMSDARQESFGCPRQAKTTAKSESLENASILLVELLCPKNLITLWIRCRPIFATLGVTKMATAIQHSKYETPNEPISSHQPAQIVWRESQYDGARKASFEDGDDGPFAI
jgi:hypothetical protein